jgi:hypothetical protein
MSPHAKAWDAVTIVAAMASEKTFENMELHFSTTAQDHFFV